MKTMSEFIRNIDLDRYISENKFETYCNVNNIHNPSLIDERKFIQEYYTNYDSDIINCEDLITQEDYRLKNDWIYERLGESLAPEIVFDRLVKAFKDIYDFEVDTKNDDTLIHFRSHKFLSHNLVFNEILNMTNWVLNKCVKNSNNIKERIYTLEPRKPSNRTAFIYNECRGIIYKIVTYRKLNKILKFGLKPRKDFASQNGYDEFRCYFIASPNKQDIIDGILENKDIIKSKNNTKDLSIIKIDLNLLHKNFNIKIQSFLDTRHNHPCYWTSEYIPGSCICDDSENFKEYLI